MHSWSKIIGAAVWGVLLSSKLPVRPRDERWSVAQEIQGALRVVAGMFILTCSIGCEAPVSERECEDLLQHYTENQIEQARPSTSRRERVELKRAAQSKAQLDPEFAQCTSVVSRTQFRCAMMAQSADQIERCLL